MSALFKTSVIALVWIVLPPATAYMSCRFCVKRLYSQLKGFVEECCE
jgi:hypothetical protein